MLVLLANAQLAAQDLLNGSWTSLNVPCAHGQVPAYVLATPIPYHPSSLPGAWWTTYVHTAYFPTSGYGWNGTGYAWGRSAEEDRLALVDNCVLGMFYASNVESLYVTVSTNTHKAGLTNVSSVMLAELALCTNSLQRFLLQPQFRMKVEAILGSHTFRDHLDTNHWNGHIVFLNTTRPSRFTELTVEGTNAVVTLEIGTNITARIAFNKSVVPVWATTNGVSIGRIATNCVFHSQVISNDIVTRVVY